ncbi:ABC transporter permease [Dehalobacter sp. DCM]|uniref:ABC transporter permease n=1 Tax=Dehalobacter sp. DCM TaxID=2907827 RepID=UPI003081BF08|nr:ABC transporter permease [Dehalobacter sp. DCM]
MIRVKNKKAIRNLSDKSLRASRLRNSVAVIAIILTTVLFTALFTIGGSIMDTLQENTMRQVGTRAHAGFKFLTQQQYDSVCKDPKIKDISYNILIGFGENPELNKIHTEIRWTEAKAAEWSYSIPTTGSLPEERHEVAASTDVLDALGVLHQLGAQVPLEFTANGVYYSQTFTLSGFWEQDKALAANQVYLSREYCDAVAPVITIPVYENPNADMSYLAGSINPSFWFATSWDIDGQVSALMARCGFDPQYVNSGVNWAYASATVDAQMILAIAGFLLLVLLSGYLIIYNIFTISVSRDIRFYGLLKTIGTTGRQIKHIVRRQAFLLCLLGIPFGLILGWLCGKVIMPAVMRSTNFGDAYVISVNPLIFVGAALFSLFTVWVSCIRPSRLAARVSPVEAIRYTGVSATCKKKTRKYRKSTKVTPVSMAIAGLQRDRKKTVVVLLSLSLSLVLLNAAYTIVKGFDMEKYVSERVVSDFIISDASIRNSFTQTEVLDGVTPQATDKIKHLPGLEDIGSVYMKESRHVLDKNGYRNTMKVLDKYSDELPMPYAEETVRMAREEHTLPSHIYGMDTFTAEKLTIRSGKPDMEKFRSGNYVIVSSFYNTGEGIYYQVGDRVTIDFGNGVKKEYEVLAVGMPPYALGPQHSHYLDIYFTLPTGEYTKMLGKTQPLCTAFDVNDAHIMEAEAWIADYCTNVETSLDYESRYSYIKQFEDTQTMFAVVGGALSIILGLIGVLNFMNAVVTSIMSRKRELAMLQSVGMTGKQLQKMVIYEGFSYAGMTLLFALTVGSAVCYGLVWAITNQMWFFTYHFTLLPVLLCAPLLLTIAALIPVLAYKMMARESIVERLRETE